MRMCVRMYFMCVSLYTYNVYKLSKYSLYIKRAVIPTWIAQNGCTYPHIKADSLQFNVTFCAVQSQKSKIRATVQNTA